MCHHNITSNLSEYTLKQIGQDMRWVNSSFWKIETIHLYHHWPTSGMSAAHMTMLCAGCCDVGGDSATDPQPSATITHLNLGL